MSHSFVSPVARLISLIKHLAIIMRLLCTCLVGFVWFVAQPASAADIQTVDTQIASRQATGDAVLKAPSVQPDSTAQNMVQNVTQDDAQTKALIEKPTDSSVSAQERMTQVFAVVRPKGFTQAFNTMLKQKAQTSTPEPSQSEIELYAQPLPESEFDLLYVFDGDNRMDFLTQNDAAKLQSELGMSASDFFLQSLDNLKTHLSKHKPELFGIEEKEHHFFAYMADSVYESSALFFADELAKQAKIDNAVYFLPARDVLLMVSSDDTGALRHVGALAKHMFDEKDNKLSPYGYRIENGKLQRVADDATLSGTEQPAKSNVQSAVSLNYTN